MGKKLIKNSPIRKSVVETFISAEEESRKADNAEIRKTVETKRRKDVNTDKQEAVSIGKKKQVKLTFVVPEEVDLLLED